MQLPDKLLSRQPQLIRKTAKDSPYKAAPMFRTYRCLLTFDDGTRLGGVEVSMPNRPYWPEQLEQDIMRQLNDDTMSHAARKVTRVKVFRDTREGGFLIRNGRVVRV